MTPALLLASLLQASPVLHVAGVSLDNHHGIFPADPSRSKGPIEGFRQVFLDPKDLASLTPVEAGGSGDTLVLPNDTSTSIEVLVGGVSVGIIGPFETGRLHGVAPGTYEITWKMPHGYTFTRQVATTSEQGED